ncbi:NAD-dependent epimerase/dehydratase family protein [Microbacterium flavescens]|uniref:NAD-dependent epimerase/dehydratase family protein n=1 Tax=Microbacterium flavescens TaxID=69366 RepID=UPI001BDF0A9C|nr:NAD-dependent epimerase/dehydratase family protein [Microbacterium flavescens]BFF09073.1 GDP-6-deoxy-D-mannose reductase [Microbacterium flavescens]
MTQRTLAVTGVDGFVGRHVARLAVEGGWRVVGLSRAKEPVSELSSVLSDYHAVDLARQWPEAVRADAVIHLAGLAAVGPSFDRPQEYIETNSAIVTLMCEAMLGWDRLPRVIGVSSGAVYGAGAPTQAVDEGNPTAPTSPYVVSKLLVEQQLGYYARRGLDTVIARPFNHIGPGQGRGFLVPDLTTALRELAPGDPLSAGNLASERDYTDVRDVAAAYLMLAGAPSHEQAVYNVCSGRAVSGHEMLALVASALGIPLPRTIVDPARVRAIDSPRITGSAARLRNEFGWEPQIDVAQSVEDFVAG